LNLLHGWGRSDILALVFGILGVATTVVVAIVSPLGRMIAGLWRAAMLRAGFPRRRYARWFITKKWGIYENPYLDDVENLDLRNTFVPLSFRKDDAPDTLTLATAVLGDHEAGNLIIDGGPGSGKSTLLKAYGVAVLRERPLLSRGNHLVPFLVQLRKLARFLAQDKGVAEYLVNEILVGDVGMPVEQARHFLEHSIKHRHVVVMFDGLDEVTADHYQAVLEAVFKFKNDNSPDCPTSQARLLLTCRRQNFLAIRDDWVPAFQGRECSLAPLRNSDIFSYLDKVRAKFRAPNNAESFLQAVRASGTLDLHRTPLILAMSVGLYSRKQYFEIPSSIAELYKAMIREMLDRHSFRRDHGGAALLFQVDDKYQFLREFSLYAAEQSGRFDDFTRAELATFAEGIAPRLNAVRDAVGMVSEIIDRAGLVSDVGEKGAYVFAHRSIQEYLVAEELRALADGDAVLVGKATDPEWRQVILFYSAGQEQRHIDHFLRELSKRNPDLAAYCLAVAKPSAEVAEIVLDALNPIDDMNLPGLASATISPRAAVQEMAIERLRAALTAPGSILTAINADVEGMLPLLNFLVGTNAAEITAIVPQIIAGLPDDPRLVESLWRCLTAPGIESLPECRAIVQRLLDLVMDPNSLEELGRQDRYDRDFITAAARRVAYPFKEGLDQNSNLVTLLAWADRAEATPSTLNRFFLAKEARLLDKIERDRRRVISFSPFWPARIFSGLGLLAACAASVAVLSIAPGDLLRPFGWWNLGLIIGAAAAPLSAAAALDGLTNLLGATPPDRDGNAYMAVADIFPNWLKGPIGISIVPLSFAVAAIPLAAQSLTGYIALPFGTGCLFWLTTFGICARGRKYYVYKPNEFVDVYDDPRSMHWLGVKNAAPTAPAAQQTP